MSLRGRRRSRRPPWPPPLRARTAPGTRAPAGRACRDVRPRAACAVVCADGADRTRRKCPFVRAPLTVVGAVDRDATDFDVSILSCTTDGTC